MYHEGIEIIVAGLSGIAAIIVAVVAIIQSRTAKDQAETAKTQTNLMKEELDASLRPWIGLAIGGFMIDSKTGAFAINLTNYGKIPPKSIMLRIRGSGNMITEEEIMKTQQTVSQNGIIFPEQNIVQTIVMTSELKKVKKGEINPYYFGVMIEYEYGNNKTGQSFIVMSYNHNAGIFPIEKSWAK